MRSETVSWVARGAGLAIGVGLVLVVAGLLSAGRDVLILVFLAVLLGAALEPVVGFLRARLHFRRALAILAVYATFLAIVVLISLFVVPAAAVQLGSAFGRLPEFLHRVRGWTDTLRPEALSQGIGSLLDLAEQPLKPGPPPDPETVLAASLVLFQAAAAIITVLALVFFWLTERSRLQRYALAFAPADRRAGLREGWNEVEARLGAWVRGQLLLMATLGVATAIAYTLLGLPGALLLGLIAAIMEVVPIVGALLGAIPALIVATTISPETAVLTLGVYLLIQGIEGNVLVPMIMRNSVGLSPLLVLLSLLIGGTVGGILGAMVAVPLVAAFTVILERLQDRDTPVPIDPAALPDEASRDELKSTAPDSPAKAKRTTKKAGTAEA